MLDILTQSPYYPTPTVAIVLTPSHPQQHTRSQSNKRSHRQGNTPLSCKPQPFHFDDSECFSQLNRPRSSIQASHPTHQHRKAVSQVFNIKQLKPSADSTRKVEAKPMQGEHAQLIKTISLRAGESAAIEIEEEQYRASTSHSIRRKWKQPQAQRQLQCYAFSQPHMRAADSRQWMTSHNGRMTREEANKVMERGWSEQRSRRTANLKASQQSFLQFSVIRPKQIEAQPLHFTNEDNYVPAQSAQQRRVYLNMLHQIRTRDHNNRRSNIHHLQGRNHNDQMTIRPQVHTSHLERKRGREERNELRPWEVDCNQVDFI